MSDSAALKEWCNKYKFADKIYAKLIELEFESPEDLKVLPDEDINDLCKEELKIKYGAKGRFLNAIKDLKNGININDENKENDNGSKAKTLRLYQSSNQWKLIFYEGTPAAEMKKSIREIAGIDLQLDFILLDADGNNVILSSYIADNTQLHLQAIEPLPMPASVNDNDANNKQINKSGYNDFVFKWDATSRTCDQHVVKDNGMTIGQSIKDKGGWGHTYANMTMKYGTGIYVWSILYNPIQCCIYSSLNDVRKYKIESMQKGPNDVLNPSSVFEKKVFNDAFRNGQGYSDGNEKPLEVIYICDMNKKKLWLFKKGENNKAKILINNLPREVQPFVTLKHVVWITITGFGEKIITENKLNISNTAENVMNAK
eukprot:98058_1